MTGHSKWFEKLKKPEIPGYVQTGDNTHAIQHICDIHLWKARGKSKYMMNVLHAPNLAKNLVSVGQTVEQGILIKINKAGSFIEKHRTLIA
jgi:hypothetical protein